MQNVRNNGLIRFGAFELKKDTGELRKQGIKIRLQGKPVQLLQALLERPGELVTRDELHKRLWPVDAEVDFESGLNTAANRLRIALGDSADHPHYVETLARLGYRFIGPVSEDTEVSTVATLIPTPPHVEPPPASTMERPRRQPVWVLPLVLGLVAAAVAGALLLRRKAPSSATFRQLTFRRMSIGSARFGPDGQTVIYEGREQYGKRDLFLTHPSGPESRPLGFERCTLASISRAGELALLTHERAFKGELLRVPMNGGAPLPVDTGIAGADWTIDGRNLAVLRGAANPNSVEFPRGKSVYQSNGWLSHPRVSPDGRSVAFFEHPVRGDDGGIVKLVDSAGKSRVLTEAWASTEGLAWAPSGREIWFAAARTGVNRSLYAVDLSGQVRLVASFPGTLSLFDISSSGHVLLSLDQMRFGMIGTLDGDNAEKDLSWFDYSRAVGLSDDGRVLLFDETGEGGGEHYSAYIRRAGGSSAVRIGEGAAIALSHSGTWALTASDRDRSKLNLVPFSSGDTKTIYGQGVNYDWVEIFPGDKRLLIGGSQGGKPGLFTQTLDGAKPQPLKAGTYLTHAAISPDGTQLAGVDAQAKLVIVPIDGGETKTIPIDFYTVPLRWSTDGKTLLAQLTGRVPSGIFRVVLKTGKYQLWKQMAPPDLAGVLMISPAEISRDEKSYAYSYNRTLSELFVVDGWL